MANIVDQGGWLGNGTHTVPKAVPGIWIIDDPHGVSIAVSRRVSGASTATATAYTAFTSDGSEQLIPGSTELTIVISGLSDDEQVFVGQVRVPGQ